MIYTWEEPSAKYSTRIQSSALGWAGVRRATNFVPLVGKCCIQLVNPANHG